ncbi:MAG: hypothetical protein ACYC4R_00505 [Anaerolineae bacterium]
MDVGGYQEFGQWTRADAPSAIDEKRAALAAYCAFCGRNPHALIQEARQAADAVSAGEPPSHVAEKRLRAFYRYLLTAETAGGRGFETGLARAYFSHIRAFYKKHGLDTRIEAIADWETGPELQNLRTQPFGGWDWREADR